MIVLDIETTGTEPQKHSILSIGAIEFEKPNNQFYEECRMWEGAHIMNEALEINGFTKEQICDKNKKTDKEIVENFINWAVNCDSYLIAGQNPSFDRDFIKYTAERYHINWPLSHRTIDLHSICYFHMIDRGVMAFLKNGKSNINSDTIMRYVGIPNEPKPHKAINGAKYETEAFYRFFYKKPLFDEFKDYKIPWVV